MHRGPGKHSEYRDVSPWNHQIDPPPPSPVSPGRLASLAKSLSLGAGMEQRFRPPLHFIALCEMEMLARSTKHLVFESLRDRADLRAAPGPTLLHILNSLFGATSSPSPSPPRNGPSPPAPPSKKTKGKVRKGHPSTQPQRTAPLPPCLEATPDEIRALLLSDIRRCFRYTLTLPAQGAQGLSSPMALLRRVCQKLGLRMHSRAYDLTTPEPFHLSDIVDIVPLVKSCAPNVALEEAKEMLDNGRLLARAGNAGVAYEYVQEAASLFHQVLGPIHKDVAACQELVATLLFQVRGQGRGKGRGFVVVMGVLVYLGGGCVKAISLCCVLLSFSPLLLSSALTSSLCLPPLPSPPSRAAIRRAPSRGCAKPWRCTCRRQAWTHTRPSTHTTPSPSSSPPCPPAASKPPRRSSTSAPASTASSWWQGPPTRNWPTCTSS